MRDFIPIKSPEQLIPSAKKIIKEEIKTKIKEIVSPPIPKVRLKDKFSKYRSVYSTEKIIKEEGGSVSGDSINGNRPKTPFTKEQLDEFWELYITKHIDQKNRSLITTLNRAKPELHSGFHLVFPIENVVQKQQIDAISLDLVAFLREKLNNFSLDLDTPIKKIKKEKNYYSAEERYKYLAEKYPLVEELRKKLDLDFDY